MAGGLPRPRVFKNPQSTQLSYELPHRIYTSKVYPLLSSNGSTVILYAHENGVKLVWRGGRPFKDPRKLSAPSQKTNGAKDTVITLDSDDEGDSAVKLEDKPEFEDEEEELDPTQPYPGILQELDLHFGTAVLDVALLPEPILRADGPSWRGLESLKQKIVFTAACADTSLRLVTIPLTPPSPKSKARPELRSDFTLSIAGKGTWGETIVQLGGHQKPSDGLSMTVEFTISPTKTPGKATTPTETQIIIASHSREVTGRLLLYRVPVKSPNPAFDPFQSVCLSSPAKSISFKPTLTRQHSSHLLVAHSLGICRVYDYKISSKTNEEASDVPANDQGTWLLSLYTGFQSTKSDVQIGLGTHTGYGRKTIVDAQWVAAGRAIIVLQSDGEWFIWDIEGVGPGAPQSLLTHQGIKGGSISEYSLAGFIDSALKPRTSGPPQINSSKFAPMTPGTRKSIEPFGSRASNGLARGQISVIEIPSASPTTPSDESVLFWLGETFVIIPNLAKYWAANAGKKSSSGGFFTGTSGSRAIKLDNVELQGERCSAVAQVPRSGTSTGLHGDIIIVAEHRFIILSTANSTKKSESRIVLLEKNKNPNMNMNGGELDVVGIEQALARMENGNTNGNANGKLVQRKLF